MSAILRTSTRVLPGHRIEVVADSLRDGEQVDVIVLPGIKPRRTISMLEFLDGLPPSTMSPAEWEQFEKDFQAERDSWE